MNVLTRACTYTLSFKLDGTTRRIFSEWLEVMQGLWNSQKQTPFSQSVIHPSMLAWIYGIASCYCQHHIIANVRSTYICGRNWYAIISSRLMDKTDILYLTIVYTSSSTIAAGKLAMMWCWQWCGATCKLAMIWIWQLCDATGKLAIMWWWQWWDAGNVILQ